MTVAPTMPVEAASTVPTRTTEMPSPPRRSPKSRPIVTKSCSAMPDRSSIMPMKMKSGTATSTSLSMIPR